MHDATTIGARYATRAPKAVGPAMTFILMLARERARARGSRARGSRSSDSAVTSGAPGPQHRREERREDPRDLERLWETAEQYHPEQTWLAESWVRGERTLDELRVIAPREALAPGLVRALQNPSPRRDARVLEAGPIAARTFAVSAALPAFG